MHSFLHKAALCMALLCATGEVCAQNILRDGGTLTTDFEPADPAQGISKLADGNTATSYIAPASQQIHITYQSDQVSEVLRYAITVGTDSLARNPAGWMLFGAPDGKAWTALDAEFGISFTAGERKVFKIASPVPYTSYQLIIFFNSGSPVTEIAELELMDYSNDLTPPVPTAKAQRQDVVIRWSNAGNEKAKGMVISRSDDGIHFVTIDTAALPAKQYTDANVRSNALLLYRLRVLDSNGVSKPSPTVSARSNTLADLPSLNRFADKRVYDTWNIRNAEGIQQAFDDNIYTKLYCYRSFDNLTYVLDGGATAKQYAVTSGNDAPERDPYDWVLEASADSSNWTPLDTRHMEYFIDRHQRKLYPLTNTKSYKYYRLRILTSIGGNDLQLADFQLMGDGNGQVNKNKPAKPGLFQVYGNSPYQLALSWTDSAMNETGYVLQYSADSLHWNSEVALDANSSAYFHRHLHPMTQYYYRLRAENAYGTSAWAYASARTVPDAPPATWQEHWYEHRALLDRVYMNNDIAMYFDYAVDRQQSEWTKAFYTSAWQYVKKNYGSFCDPRLYVVLHSMPPTSIYSGGHPSVVFDSSHDYRNVTDVAGNWADTGNWNHGASVHEMCHIVEGSADDVWGSPAFGLWGDSKWAEIFVYDVYNHMGPAYAYLKNDLYTQMQTQYDDFPRKNTQWFKNWFYPIYDRSADSSQALSRYFLLVSQYFPQHDGAYSKSMNMGEFVHFWSGAAGYNLKQQADTAFGWTDQLEIQFQQARIDYPFTYPDEAPVKTPPSQNGHGGAAPCKYLYPNPASGTIYLDGPDPSENYLVDVYALNGQRVLQTRAMGNNVPLNIASLHNGIYLFVVNSKRSVAFTRLVAVFNK
ncbi:hypothetical protein DCC81_13120 [Chitinophaga parva]|uniref:Fibronectin type-III domain-containing protein n=1 Tax=Chitinophaga parva TaxID=2169414 RepID=A0A2T7BG91_9BACT|nr:T9SS type A sorting domain-containing protein [Chitinophaga parva]PUZ25243.1 hypothetical protein DCC81_13120 [Chitinophaga parva]